MGRFASKVLCCLLFATPLYAVTVTNTNDNNAVDGGCSIREAILATNTDAAVNECVAGSGFDIIEFTIAGAGPHTIAVTAGNGPLPVITDGVTINGYSEPGSVANSAAIGSNAVIMIQIDGTGVPSAGGTPPDAYGLRLGTAASGSSITGLSITNHAAGGILVQASSTTVTGNFLGLTPAGADAGNGASESRGGVDLLAQSAAVNISNVTIGGTTPAARNYIAGNVGGQVTLSAFTGGVITNSTIHGNYLGTNLAGTATGGVGGAAISIFGANNILIGGSTGTFAGNACTGACNLISGNSTVAVVISSDGNHPISTFNITMQGNIIGLDAAGTSAIGNGTNQSNVLLSGAVKDIFIGGNDPSERNVISGASGAAQGISIQNFDPAEDPLDTNDIFVQGNYIGTNSAGTAALGNGRDGILVQNTPHVLIGGTGAGEGNVISGNGTTAGGGFGFAGIQLMGGADNIVQGNLIGVGANGTTSIPNTGRGVELVSGSFNPDRNLIGAATSGGPGGNIIANNGSAPANNAGVYVDSGVQNRISTNSIFNNTGTATSLAIDLTPPAGVTANDNCDGDTGNNNLQNFPVLTTATGSATQTTISGSLNSVASTTFTIEFYRNSVSPAQAQTFMGSTTVTTSAGCTDTFSVTVLLASNSSHTITALAIDPVGNTSELSAAIVPTEAPIQVAKSFNPTSIASGGVSQVTITLTNPNSIAASNVAFTDNLPAGMTVANPASASTTCGGSVTATPGAAQFSLSGGAVAATSSCQVQVNVTATATGTNTIPIGAVTSTPLPANDTAASDTLTVTSGPVVTKAFAPTEIGVNGVSTLTITLTNPSGSPMTATAFTDTYPAGLVNAAFANVSTSCGGTASTPAADQVALSGGTVPASSFCTVTVNVTSATAGSYTNTIPAGGVTSSAGANTAPASSNLTVLNPLTVTKAFGTDPITTGGTSLLTITLTNPNATAVTGAAFTDTHPAGVINATPANGATTCSGTVTAVDGAGSVALSGGTVPANSSCTVTVTVTSSTLGTHNNTIPAGDVTTTNAGPSTAAASDSLTVLGGPTVAKAFAPTSIATGGTSVLTITLGNPNTGTALTGIAFTDTYPAAITNAAAPASSTTCGGSVTAAAGGPSVALSGGAIPAGSTCTVSVTVTSSTLGDHVNTIAAGDVASAEGGSNAAPADATLTVGALSPPTVTKAFNPATVSTGGTTQLTITLSNSNALPITGVAFTDNYPAGLVNAALPNAANTCGGVVTAAPGGGSLSLTGGTIPGSGSCTVSVNVTAQPAFTNGVNTIPAGGVTSANAPPSGGAASATLTAVAAETIPTLSFTMLLLLSLVLAAVAFTALRR